MTTALGVTLALFDGRIEQGLREQRGQANAPLVEAAQSEAQAIKQQLLGNLEQDITAVRGQLQLAVDNQRQALQTAQSLRTLANEARSEADKELKGDAKNSPAGPGSRHREWQRRETGAQSAESAARDAAQMAKEQQQTLKEEIDAKQQDLQDARGTVEQELTRLQRRMESDTRWQPERGDLLSRITMLSKLKQDPVDGAATRGVYLIAISCLIAFELMFLIIKLFFMPPSVYKLRLITATRAEGLKVREDHDEEIARVLGGLPYAQLHVSPQEGNAPRRDDDRGANHPA